MNYLKVLILGTLFASLFMGCDDETTSASHDEQAGRIDTIYVAGGRDTIYAEVGKDTVYLQGGIDTVFVNNRDTIVVNSKDTVFVEGGKDTLYLQGGVDTVLVNSKDTVVVNHKDTVVVKDSVEVSHKDTVVVNHKDTVYVAYVDSSSQVDYSRKSFFLKGSKITIHELESGKTLRQTGNVLINEISSSDGVYKYSANENMSQYMLYTEEGFFYNVVTGKASDAPICLKLLSDVMMHLKLYVNVLTHLEYERVRQLVVGSSMKVYAAKAQAEKEIMSVFHILPDSVDMSDPEEIYMFDGSNRGNCLLALTILLLGDRSDGEFRDLLADISNGIASKGVWNNTTARKQMANWARNADSSGRLSDIQKKIANGVGKTNINFIKYIRYFYKSE